MLKFLYLTRSEGIIYWRSEPHLTLPKADHPILNCNLHDLRMDGRPYHQPLDLHGYMDSEWATYPLTCRSMGGACVRLSGGTVAYKVNLLL